MSARVPAHAHWHTFWDKLAHWADSMHTVRGHYEDGKETIRALYI